MGMIDFAQRTGRIYLPNVPEITGSAADEAEYIRTALGFVKDYVPDLGFFLASEILDKGVIAFEHETSDPIHALRKMLTAIGEKECEGNYTIEGREKAAGFAQESFFIDTLSRIPQPLTVRIVSFPLKESEDVFHPKTGYLIIASEPSMPEKVLRVVQVECAQDFATSHSMTIRDLPTSGLIEHVLADYPYGKFPEDFFDEEGESVPLLPKLYLFKIDHRNPPLSGTPADEVKSTPFSLLRRAA